MVLVCRGSSPAAFISYFLSLVRKRVLQLFFNPHLSMAFRLDCDVGSFSSDSASRDRTWIGIQSAVCMSTGSSDFLGRAVVD